MGCSRGYGLEGDLVLDVEIEVFEFGYFDAQRARRFGYVHLVHLWRCGSLFGGDGGIFGGDAEVVGAAFDLLRLDLCDGIGSRNG